MSEKQPVGVVGAGWVGLVSAACFAELGHRVIVRDVVSEKVESLKRGELTIYEPGLSELVQANSERLEFTADVGDLLSGAKLLFVCVDTPPTPSGDADLTSVRSVVEDLRTDGEHTMVMKSTVPVGTGRTIMRDLADISYVSCPEFLREGSAVEDFLHPDRVVVGAEAADASAGAEVEALYEPVGAPVIRTDVSSAEMIKLASNAFLATKISFINEIANVCEELGADVIEVSRGMGLDQRIGPKFLRPGIGYGGSCLAGSETVLTRRDGKIEHTTLAALFSREADSSTEDQEVATPRDLEVLSWRQGESEPEFLPVSAVTRRRFEGEACDVVTKMGRRVRCTPDHPFVVSDGKCEDKRVVLAEALTDEDWLPIAQGAPSPGPALGELDTRVGAHFVGVTPDKAIVRIPDRTVDAVKAVGSASVTATLVHPRGHQRYHDIVRAYAMRLDEMHRLSLPERGSSLGTTRNGTYLPASLAVDEDFWRVVGLYIAEGHCTVDGTKARRSRIQWSFHPTHEMELVAEVEQYWARSCVKTAVRRGQTSTSVSVSSRLLAGWWLGELGLGANCYEHRIPDLIWDQPRSHKEALISGMWMGDGSWSYVAKGPSMVLEYGTASPLLADGLLRLLGDLGFVARLHVGRTAKSTTDNFWLTISGADQVERALAFVKPQDREGVQSSIDRQAKRIKPTGYRHDESGTAWVRVRRVNRVPFEGDVFSLEVPEAHTFVTSGGLVTHNCFPKDVSALKQLAGNSGYHFQLLTAVIEVNELQKRRVIKKLEKHLGSLVGKRIAMLGLAFKPETDDLREASSLVLAPRLQGEGATVVGYDPVASEAARTALPGVELAGSAIEALEGADAAILVTEWPEFADLDWSDVARKMKSPVLIDGRNFLDPERLREAGFTFEGVGRGGSAESPEAVR